MNAFKKGFTRTLNLVSGFTLIELLVVVAIIGILASVVLAALNGSRTKGTDAAIKSALANARAQAELYQDGTQSYDTVCTDAGGVSPLVLNALQKLNSSAVASDVGDDSVAWVYDPSGGAGSTVCHDDLLGWAAKVSMKGTANSGWCVDSTGISAQSTTALVANDYSC